MVYKFFTGSLIVLFFLSGVTQAGEHGKNAPDSHAKHAQQGQGDHAESQGHEKKHILRKVISAVSKTGLNAEQVILVTQAVNQFKLTKQNIKTQKQFPIDAFKDDGFDQKAFRMNRNKLGEMKIQAKVDLFEGIYAILDAEQKKIFSREFTAPMIEKMIKKNMLKGKDIKNNGMQSAPAHH